MKTIILSITLFFASMSMFANNDNTMMLTNVNGNVKECTIVDKETRQPIKKTVYENNENGLPTTKILYKWDDKQGWVYQCRNGYTYDVNNNVTSISYQIWDAKKQDWTDKK